MKFNNTGMRDGECMYGNVWVDAEKRSRTEAALDQNPKRMRMNGWATIMGEEVTALDWEITIKMYDSQAVYETCVVQQREAGVSSGIKAIQAYHMGFQP
eukprot:gene4305-3120_t